MQSPMSTPPSDEAVLRAGDLIPDRALTKHDTDQFGHTAIAERVADLLTTAEPPLNVSLFGAWGSGKSSFATLLKEALGRRRMKTAFVHYDAWKYSGEALQRSFIAEAAEQLKVADPFYSSQLAQTVERTHVDLKQASWKQSGRLLLWAWRMVVPIAAIGVGLFVVGVVAVSAAADKSISRELLRFLPLFAIPVGIGVLTAALKLIADSAAARSIEAPPTEERFEDRFRSLLKVAAKNHSYQRFVFFIDELDRVAARDVVATLAVIKNFLDQKNAVFVVAADKQVLERAFTKLPQATPTNEDEPYYSSASEFLDKIFQHQLTLPPLRGSTLLRFARDLVADRESGLWQELEDAAPDGTRLDGVLYALIASHVRSPRRVKVLLNNFATNARIAQSRGIDWMARAEEIAKLTALQTEFPLFASDLDLEPRLPKLVLDSSGYVLSERARRLLSRHQTASDGAGPVHTAASADENDEVDASTASEPGDGQVANQTGGSIAGAELALPTDRLLVPSAEQGKLISVQRENLRRYLQRTERVPDPSRELLFLEAGGATEGLADPELGELLEAEVVDNPAAVVAAARQRPKEDQQAIVRVLAGMSEQAYSEERANIVTALLDVVRLLDGDLGPSLAAANAAVSGFARTQTLHERQLTGALRVGIAGSKASGDTSLRDLVLEDERLLGDPSRVWTVGYFIDDLPEDAAEEVRDAIAEHLPETTDVLTEPLFSVSPAAADQLLRHGSIREAIQTVVKSAASDEAEDFISNLFSILDRRAVPAPNARLRLMRLLADSGTPVAYAALRERADDALSAAGTSQITNGVALAALPLAPTEDWELWLRWLDPDAEAYGAHKRMADLALIKLAGLLPQADEHAANVALELAPRVATVGRLEDDDVSPTLTQAVQGALQVQAWWSGGSAFDAQARIHEIVRALGEAIGDGAASSFASLRHQDLVRAASGGGLTQIVLGAVPELAVEMGAAEMRDLATRLAAAPPSGDEARDVELISARTHLWKEAWELEDDATGAPYDIEIAQVVAVTRSGSRRGQQVVVAWLEFRVTPSAVHEIIVGIDRGPAEAEAQAFREWLANLKNADARTKFLTRLASDGGYALEWLRAAAAMRRRDYSEQVIAHSIVSEAMTASRAEERRALVSALSALDPREAEAQREVGSLIVWLLGLGQKADFDTATAAVVALGSKHGNGRKIGNAFREAIDEGQPKIRWRDRDAFSQAKIVLGQGYFESPPKKKGRLSRLLGG